MKHKTVYVCEACGATSAMWAGQCPGCKKWNTLAERTVAKKPAAAARAAAGGTRAVELAEVSAAAGRGEPTGIEELDRLLGRGLVPGAAILLGGEPGIGKSTLLLQLAGQMAGRGGALYVSGEESLPQLQHRAKRLGALAPGLRALSISSADEAREAMERDRPALMILDSVQTFASALAEGVPGSVSQVRAVSSGLIEAAKASGTALVLVGHVTKEGQIAGPKLMEHMVDTVLYLEGDRRQAFRILRVLKNRFGPTDELAVFRMEEAGLVPVPDPSTFFLDDRDPSLPGTALVMAVDGNKPFAVEVQALCAKSFLSMPRRTALGFDANRLHLILAVLERRLRLNLGQFDVYAKIGGGLKLAEPGLDLGVAAAVLSSFYDRAVPENAVFFGELDLNGRIRPCPGQKIRTRQAKRLGYQTLCAGEGRVATLTDLAARLFGAGG